MLASLLKFREKPKQPETVDLGTGARHRGHRQFYRENGFTVFRSVLPMAVIDALRESIATDVDAFEGPLPRHNGDAAPHVRNAEGRMISAIRHPHLVNEPKLTGFRKAIRDVCCNAAIAECFRELNGMPTHVVNGTLLFFISPLTDIHDDSWSCNTFPHGGSFTVWIPLEDIHQFSGPPFVVRWPIDRFMRPQDLGIKFPPENTPGWAGIAQGQYGDALKAKVQRDGLSMIVPLMRRGDILVFGPLTPHGSLPGYPLGASRLSLQAIYRPAGVPWGAYDYESGKHRFGPAVREERAYNEQFAFALPPDMQW